MAHKLLKTGVSAILDLYELSPKDRRLFVKGFCDALIDAPKDLWHDLFLTIDEAQLFAPEGGKSESHDSVVRLCQLGRKRGYGITLATPRLSTLSKDCAATCNNKLIGLTPLDIDRARVAEDLGFQKKADAIVLRKLQPGTFFAYGPAICNDNEITEFKVKKPATRHIESGKQNARPIPTPAAIKSILAEMQDLPTEADAELRSKEQLQAEVTRLRGEVTRLTKTATSAPADTELIGELRQANQQLQQQIQALQKHANAQAEHFNKTAKFIRDGSRILPVAADVAFKLSEFFGAAEKLVKESGMPPIADVQKPTMPPPSMQNRLAAPAPTKTSRPVPAAAPDGNSNGSSIRFGKAHKALLEAVAMCGGQNVPLQRVAFLAGLNPNGGHFNNIKGECRRANWLEIDNNVFFSLTADGKNQIGGITPLPTDPHELIEFWSRKLAKRAGQLFLILEQHYPSFIDRTALAAEADINAAGGHFSNCLSEMRILGLLEEEGKTLRISASLYE